MGLGAPINHYRFVGCWIDRQDSLVLKDKCSTPPATLACLICLDFEDTYCTINLAHEQFHLCTNLQILYCTSQSCPEAKVANRGFEAWETKKRKTRNFANGVFPLKVDRRGD